MNENTIYQDGTYLENNPSWHEEDSPWKAKQVEKILKNNNIIPLTVCEIGCGAGEILKCLANVYGDDVVFYGYEVSPQAFKICRKKEQKNIHFLLKDALDENTNPFDVVMAIDVFEHVEDYLGFLRKFKAKGTYKIFHIPLDLSAQRVLRISTILQMRKDSGHLHYFTKETALATLEYAGYEIVDYFYTKINLDLPARGLRNKLLKLIRRLLFSANQDLTVRALGGFSLIVLTK